MSTAERMTSVRGDGARERSRVWIRHLEKIEAEGVTAKAYAAREGFSVDALYQAKKRLVARGAWPRPRTTAEPTFARVKIVTPPMPPAPWALRLRLPSGAVLEWSAQPEAAVLAMILGPAGAPR
jgi:hypothetical protein